MLKLFNTLSRKIEKFEPQKKNEVSMYTCGPTVYDFSHIGNLRSYIFADILKRTLIFFGHEVKHVINVTDVGHLTGDGDSGEDKIEKSARRESKSAQEIAEFYFQAFKKDLKKLNIIEPSIWCKATEHIAEQIDFIKKLEEKGFVYKIFDGLYFDTSKLKDYGKLARLNLSGQEAGARIDINSEKKNQTDFAVWKCSPKNEKRQMEWASPWGIGFPGWHIECSAMSMKYLGELIDIHTGGIDHIPVHHTNEIAQSEALLGKPFVRFWLHGEFLLLNENKMAKSEGGFITLQTLIDRGFEPMVYRFFCLSAHYRSKLNFSWEALENAREAWQKFKLKFIDLGQQKGRPDKEFLEKFKAEINNDMSMPQAVALAWEVFKSNLADNDKRATLIEFDKIFGLNLLEAKEDEVKLPEEIQALFKGRNEARLNKKWKKADELREKIEAAGWLIDDSSSGSKAHKKID